MSRMAGSRLAAALGLLLLAAGPALALSSPSEMLANPVLEKRAEAIGMQLRCVVCQNESIEQSDATLAAQFRAIIRQRVTEGCPISASWTGWCSATAPSSCSARRLTR